MSLCASSVRIELRAERRSRLPADTHCSIKVAIWEGSALILY